MRSNRSGCAVQNSCVAGVCTFCRKATQRHVASAAIGTVIVLGISPNAASCLSRLVSQPCLPKHRPPASALRSLMQTPSTTQPRAVQSAQRRCGGLGQRGRKAGGSSCTAVFARIGITMTKALLDNALQHEFVGHFRAARTISRCALRRTSVDFRRSFADRSVVELPSTPHNRCDCFDGHDRTVQNPGDNLAAGR